MGTNEPTDNESGDGGNGTQDGVREFAVTAIGDDQHPLGESTPDNGRAFFAGFAAHKSRNVARPGEGKRSGDGNRAPSASERRTSEETGNLKPVPVKRTRKSAKSVRSLTSNDIGLLIGGMSALVAQIRGDHWLVSESDAASAIGVPLLNIIEKMSGATQKRIESAMSPITLATGALILFGPAIQVELERNKQNATKRSSKKTITPGNGGVTTYQGENSVSNGVSSNNGRPIPNVRPQTLVGLEDAS